MVNRIFTFIESQQLTPTEFADKIGVSRASISSIKTGRTQPTLSLVEKIKQHYPDVDINWLIFGTNTTSIEDGVKKKELLLFDEKEYEKSEEINTNSNNNIVNDYETIYIAESPRKIEKKQIESISNKLSMETNKSIKKVILLYSDGSFEEFNKD